MPGEWYAPTQPFPTKPPAYDRQGVVDRRSDRLHAGAARGGGKTGFALQDRSDLHAAGDEQGRRTARHAHPWHGQRRHQLAGWRPTIRRRTSSMPRHVSLSRSAGLVPSPGKDFSDVNYVMGTAGRKVHHTRGPGELEGADAPRLDPAEANAGWEEWEALNVRGLPLMKPPYGTISAISLESGRDRLEGSTRRYAGRGSTASRAEGLEHPPHGPGRQHRHARHQDARHCRRPGVTTTTTAHAGRCCAPTTRRAVRKWGRSSCPHRKADRP